MSGLVVITDPLTALRDWLRTLDVAGQVGTRVYAGGLKSGAAMPAITCHRVPGGGIDTPTESVALQFDCDADDAPTAAQVAAALQTILVTTGRVHLSASLDLLGFDEATVTSYPTQDPEAPDAYRNIVTAQAVLVTLTTS